MNQIRLYNTLTRKKEAFTPIDDKNVRMYVCGPTVYDRAHIGNARPVIVFDVLYRLLRHVYGPDHVTYARNFTDVDDKIIKRAAESGRKIGDITRETIDWYHSDMEALGTLRPDLEPRATAYIPQMIAMIEGLVASHHAYEAEGHVLFDVTSDAKYGRLSGRSIDDMIAGARVEIAPYKRNPMDFVLWKPSSADQPGWDSPWGRGRPGWHIECSAMSYDVFGDSFDIHGGGNDLMFPHHENEIAQSCCAHPKGDFARVWLHNEMLQVEGRKMSKSLGNFFSVRELLDKGDLGATIRYVFLSTHYRKPMNWTEEKANAAELKLIKWHDEISDCNFTDADLARNFARNSVSGEIVDFLKDDLNTHMALSHLDALDRIIPDEGERALQRAVDLKFLGLWTKDLLNRRGVIGWFAPKKYETLLANARQTAMKTKDFSQVDRIKAILLSAGIEVQMGKDGVSLSPKSDFNPAKLKELD